MRLIAIGVILFSVTLSGALAATAEAKTDLKPVDVPAGDALVTLKELSAQVGGRLLYTTESVAGVQTRAVKGRMSAAAALDAMLAGTSLVASHDAQTGALVVRRESEAEAKNVNRAIAEGSKRDRPEQRDEGLGGGTGEKVVKLDTFEVFGRKTLNMDIQRTRDDVQPYVVFNDEAIERSGATSLEDFFRTHLPMNSMATSNTQTNGSYLGATSEVNLRGLGSSQTLILVDGRRLPSINASNVGTRGFEQPDVNGIPLSAIERIEVLPTTASGIYGGAATGGVINIILKRNYSSVETRLTYENTFDTDVATRRAEFTAGLSLEGGRTHLLLNASWSDSNELLSGDRGFLQQARDQLYARNPEAFLSHTLNPPVGNATNLRNQAPMVNGVRPDLVLKSGVSLGSPFTYVPTGYAGPANDGGAALIANAGKYDISLPRTTEGTYSSLLAAPSRRSLRCV